MHTIHYLKEHGIARLTDELGITVKAYDNLYVLNYSQIDSPKTHPVVIECRGLIINKNWEVVSRSFDRFFNYGECADIDAQLDFSQAYCYEKKDGSLIKLAYYEGSWRISTRGTAYAESAIGAWNMTFEALALDALGLKTIPQLNDLMNESGANQDVTYIFELTSPYNRIVTRYDSTTLWFLAARHRNGEYVKADEVIVNLGTPKPKVYKFSSVEDCLQTTASLEDLEEGYVVYLDNTPISKIKSPKYVAIHRIRGELGLTPKRIMQLILTNEQAEYLQYFPEDEQYLTPYRQALSELMELLETTYAKVKDIEVQKDFALAIQDFPYKSVLFQARKQQTPPITTFNHQTIQYRLRQLNYYYETSHHH
ncbi:MAG: RNA ligase [Microcystaceae cyanobacterium]